MKNRKLLAALGVCAVLVAGATAVVAVSSKKEVKAAEVTTETKEAGKDTKGLTDYFRRIKMEECDIKLEADTFNWSGQVITPTVTVSYNGETLVINRDYTLKYSDNINSGVATVKVSGKGDYRGSKKLKFTIKGTDIATACEFELKDDKVVMTYNGAVVNASEYEEDWYYIDTFIKDNGVEAIYVRTTFYTITGKGRFEGTYELRSEKTYTVNNSTGEVVFK